MLDELDFTKEAANQEIFRTFLKDSGLDGEVTAPRVFPKASTKLVLTMVRVLCGRRACSREFISCLVELGCWVVGLIDLLA